MSEPMHITAPSVSAGDAPQGWDLRDGDLWFRIMSLPAIELVNKDRYVLLEHVIAQIKAAAHIRGAVAANSLGRSSEERLKALEKRVAAIECGER